jgi:hypothetical protein
VLPGSEIPLGHASQPPPRPSVSQPLDERLFRGHCFFPVGHAEQPALAVSESWPYMAFVSAGHAQAALPKVTSEPAAHAVQDAAPAREA